VLLVLYTPAPLIVSPKIWRLNSPNTYDGFQVTIVRSEPLSFTCPSARVVIRSHRSHLVESELAVIDGVMFEEVLSDHTSGTTISAGEDMNTHKGNTIQLFKI
jgi:hypothetical protein